MRARKIALLTIIFIIILVVGMALFFYVTLCACGPVNGPLTPEHSRRRSKSTIVESGSGIRAVKSWGGIRVAEVRTYFRMLSPPLVPSHHPLPESVQIFLVRHRYESPTLCLTNALVITFRTFDYRVRGTAFDYSEWQAHRGVLLQEYLLSYNPSYTFSASFISGPTHEAQLFPI